MIMSDESGHTSRIDVTESLANRAGKGWSTDEITLSCFAAKGLDMAKVIEPFGIESSAALTIQIAKAQISAGPAEITCSL